MVNNLLQKIMNGTYSSHELDEIDDAVKYAKQNYNVVNNRIVAAQKNEEKRKKLEQIDTNIENLNIKIKKSNKKQAKYILALCTVGFSALITLSLVSVFNLSLVPIFGALSVVFAAVGAVPIGLMDYKRKKLLKDVALQEQSRANLLSDICFKVTPDYANNIYKEYKKTKTKYANIESDNNITL